MLPPSVWTYSPEEMVHHWHSVPLEGLIAVSILDRGKDHLPSIATTVQGSAVCSILGGSEITHLINRVNSIPVPPDLHWTSLPVVPYSDVSGGVSNKFCHLTLPLFTELSISYSPRSGLVRTVIVSWSLIGYSF